jgi:succinate dehydrogenase / fumarate reductase iron-sulfur subunit
MASTTKRNVRVFRYDPSVGGDGDFQDYDLDCPNESAMTMLDVLLRIQREQDPTIAFRFACRVAMCGSCGMVINGKERLACKTNVADIPAGQDITLRPMNHFPVIKDLVTDMEPFFRKFRETLAFFEPKDDSPEPARIAPDAPEREEIRLATDCIACGCCVSSCTMVDHHPDYAGPAALARAYSLVADTRDALLGPRLAAALTSCHDCRTETNCTEVCPKGISPTRAIKYIQRLAITADVDQPAEALEPEKLPSDEPSRWRQIDRATFLRGAGVALLGTGVAAALGGIAAVTTIGGPSSATPTERWFPLVKLSDLPVGQVTSVLMKYDVKSGIYTQPASTTVLISRLGDEIVCYKSACPHLGCTVRWDGASDQYRCACHGGTFDRNANVVAGPPPRPLDKYQHKVEGDQLFVLV